MLYCLQCGRLYSAGWWDLRFTDGNTGTYDTAIENMLQTYISGANSSVYLANYSVPKNNTKITTSMNNRSAAGLDVKYVGDGDEGNYTGLSAGIQKRLDPAGNPIMHDKFLIIDPNSSNRKLVTGSGNYTSGGWGNQDSTWLTVTDAGIINKYLAEFNELFAGTFHGGSPTANPVTAANGVTVYTLFSPEDGPWLTGHIVDTTIRAAQESVFFETTGHDTANTGTLDFDNAVWSVLDDAGKPNFLCEGVVNSMGGTNDADFTGTSLSNYNKKGAYIRKSAVSAYEKHHSKYVVVDMDWVGVGSVNASKSASEYTNAQGNDENHIFINDFRLARAFMREFSRHYKLDSVVGSKDNPGVKEIHDWTAPGAPTGLSVTPAADSFNVSWAAPADPGDFSRYYVFVSQVNNIKTAKDEIKESDGSFRASVLRPEIQVKGRAKTSAVLKTCNEGDALASGKDYYIGVVSVDKFGNESAAVTSGPYQLAVAGGTDGSGSAALSKASVIANKNYASLTYTLTPTAGNSLCGGTVEVTVPSGWTAPQNTSSKGTGYVKAYIYKTKTTAYNLKTSVSGQKVVITGMPLNRMIAGKGDKLKLVYYKFTAQPSPGSVKFVTRTAVAGGTLVEIAKQPALTVVSASKDTVRSSIDIDTEVESEDGGVKQAALSQNYPNPFNPSTTFCYFIPESGRVTLKLYNVAGQEIDTVVDDDQALGEHSVRYDSGDKLSRGVYYYRLTLNGKEVGTKRAVILK
jgi:phosphatidylserine/phosphatidylglycerophosphate/cardiolipin synthase-like enzyme